MATSIDLTEVASGNGGLKLTGVTAGSQVGAATTGDVNGDGARDLIVSAPAEGAHGAGYVVFGPFDEQATSTLADAIADGNGFEIIGAVDGDRVQRIAASGDVNADGWDDLLITSGR